MPSLDSVNGKKRQHDDEHKTVCVLPEANNEL